MSKKEQKISVKLGKIEKEKLLMSMMDKRKHTKLLSSKLRDSIRLLMRTVEYLESSTLLVSRLKKLDLIYLMFLFYFLFSFQFIFPFSIFRTTRVRVDWSRCHICHNLMA